MLADGVAKEVARSVLPVGNQEHAQREIRRYAEAVEALFETQMPVTHRHFVEHGRKAP